MGYHDLIPIAIGTAFRLKGLSQTVPPLCVLLSFIISEVTSFQDSTFLSSKTSCSSWSLVRFVTYSVAHIRDYAYGRMHRGRRRGPPDRRRGYLRNNP